MNYTNLASFFYPKPMQRTYSFGLSENVNAKVDITGPAEIEDLEALRDYLETLIKSWKRKNEAHTQRLKSGCYKPA